MFALNGIDKIYIPSAIASYKRRERMKIRLEYSKVNNPLEFCITGPNPLFTQLFKHLETRYKDTKESQWIKSPNEVGATFGHLNAIAKAKSEGLKRVLIFEDDTCIKNDFVKLFNQAMEHLPSNFKIANLIVNAQTPNDDEIVNDFWTRTRGSSLACAYVLNMDFANYILDWYEEQYKVIDVFYYFDQYKNQYYTLNQPIAVPDPEEQSSITEDTLKFDYIDYTKFI